MNPDPNTGPQPVEPPSDAASPTPQPPNNKKLITAVAIGLGILLAILIALVVALLVQKSDTLNSSQTDSSQSTDESENKDDSRKVVKTVVLEKNPSLEVTIYQPRQTGTNTTIDYSVKNICKSGCKDHEYVDSYTLGVINESSAYLLDAESGTKFNPIVDENNKPLASEPCAGFTKPGESVSCFASFTKVSDDTTFSFVLRGLKVDGLTAE